MGAESGVAAADSGAEAGDTVDLTFRVATGVSPCVIGPGATGTGWSCLAWEMWIGIREAEGAKGACIELR